MTVFESRIELAALLSLALLRGAVAASAEGRSDLVPLPEPRLEQAESGLRERLGEARAVVDGMLSRPSVDAAELGQAFGELGRLYLASGLDVAAEAALANAAVTQPEEFRWLYYLGALQHRERRLEQSEAALRRALGLRPDDVPTLLRLGDVLLLGGRVEQARELFARARDLAPEFPGGRAFAHYGLGKVAVDAEDWRQAATHFEAVVEAQPEASAVRRLLGLAYRELGDRERARAELAASGSTGVSFHDPLMESLAKLETGAYLSAALNAQRRGDLEQAAELYRRAIEAEPQVASYHRSLSNVLELAGKIDEAVSEFERALELEPDHVASYLQLGQMLARQEGISEESLSYLRRARELAPDAREPKIALARTLAMAQRHEEALPYYDEVLAGDPRDLRARLLRARSLSRTGRDDAAVRDLESVLAVDPDHQRGILELATVLSRQGETARALELFESALDLDLGHRDRVLALFSSAGLRQQQGDDAAAIPLYRQVLELAPEVKDAHFNLAVALARTGQEAAAVEHFRRTVELDPDDVQVRLAWARALLATGDYGAARTALEDALNNAVLENAAGDADPRIINLLAQLLSTSPDPAQRDAGRAVELATRALNRDPTLQHAATLARALAAAERVEEAVALQKKIVADAQRLGLSPAQLEQLRTVLSYYESLSPAKTPESGDGSP